MFLIDTHAHLADENLRSQLPQVLHRAKQAGVQQIVAVGTTRTSSEQCLQIAKENSGVFASAGIHPNHAHEVAADDWSSILGFCNQPEVVAIGETGLDKYWDDCPWPVQLHNFGQHIELSIAQKLPLVIHTRECWPEMIEVLQKFASRVKLSGVMHSFTGSLEQAETFIAMGMHISFAGMLTFKKSVDLREVAAAIPLGQLLVETDCPYLSPEPFRGKRPNEPARVIHTAQILATAKSMSLAQIMQATTQNAHQLFHRMTDELLKTSAT